MDYVTLGDGGKLHDLQPEEYGSPVPEVMLFYVPRYSSFALYYSLGKVIADGWI